MSYRNRLFLAVMIRLAELTQNADVVTALAPDTVEFPGVTYDAQGF